MCEIIIDIFKIFKMCLYLTYFYHNSNEDILKLFKNDIVFDFINTNKSELKIILDKDVKKCINMLTDMNSKQPEKDYDYVYTSLSGMMMSLSDKEYHGINTMYSCDDDQKLKI